MGVGLVLLADAHGVHDDEAFLGPGAGGDDSQLVGRDDADAAPFHLLEEAGGLHIAQEEDALDGLHVGAGGDHVHGDGDARVEAVAEVGEDLVRREAWRSSPIR